MTLARRTLSGLAALGLAITTALTGMPAQIAGAAVLPDVAVKYDGYNYGANGLLGIAFGITNKDAAANNVSLATTCTFRFKNNGNHSRTENGQIMLSLQMTQSVPVPKLVTCVPNSGEYVSSVVMTANVPAGDSNPSNNTALWDSTSNLPKPDVKVAFMGRETNNQGWVKVLFALTDTQADAPDVKLRAHCQYRNNVTKAASSTDDQESTISLKKNQNAEPKWVTCGARPGQYVSSVSLTAEVQKPWTDANTSNNTAYWDKVTSG